MKDKILEKAIELSCEYHNVNKDDIMRRTRKIQIVLARQLVHYLLNVHALPYFKTSINIGRIVGKLDHSTVLHSSKMVKLDMMQSPRTRVAYNNIISTFTLHVLELENKESLFDECKNCGCSQFVKSKEQLFFKCYECGEKYLM